MQAASGAQGTVCYVTAHPQRHITLCGESIQETVYLSGLVLDEWGHLCEQETCGILKIAQGILKKKKKGQKELTWICKHLQLTFLI